MFRAAYKGDYSQLGYLLCSIHLLILSEAITSTKACNYVFKSVMIIFMDNQQELLLKLFVFYFLVIKNKNNFFVCSFYYHNNFHISLTKYETITNVILVYFQKYITVLLRILQSLSFPNT